jgi:ABC-type transport system substrate-binding protein
LNGFFLSSRVIAASIPILSPDLAVPPLMARSLPIHESGRFRETAWRCGNNSIFNISACKNPAMDVLIDKARFTEAKAECEAAVKELLTICMREVPVVPLNQPIHDVALKKGVGGYLFWFHREPDYRQFSKA